MMAGERLAAVGTNLHHMNCGAFPVRRNREFRVKFRIVSPRALRKHVERLAWSKAQLLTGVPEAAAEVSEATTGTASQRRYGCRTGFQNISSPPPTGKEHLWRARQVQFGRVLSRK